MTEMKATPISLIEICKTGGQLLQLITDEYVGRKALYYEGYSKFPLMTLRQTDMAQGHSFSKIQVQPFYSC